MVSPVLSYPESRPSSHTCSLGYNLIMLARTSFNSTDNGRGHWIIPESLAVQVETILSTNWLIPGVEFPDGKGTPYNVTMLDSWGSCDVSDFLFECKENDRRARRTAAAHVLGISILIALSSLLEHCIYTSFLQSFLALISV